ncbi:MAG: carbonic anhydrase family protein [Schleiferiaceae bacterium]|nr:carbonic anhydrase family protein [Schleiferiaceae bacterium]
MGELGKTFTKKQQEEYSANDVLEDLKEGNRRFVDNQPLDKYIDSLRADATAGQYPKAIILSCVDSRVPVETIFDQSIGDVFVTRIAGNVESNDVLASIEYATKVAGCKLIFVLGHESCGAVSAACDKVRMGNISALLRKIEPAIEASTQVKPPHDSSNKVFVDNVINTNVDLTCDRIYKNSDIIRNLVDTNNVKIGGGVYTLSSGKVQFFDS